ncbi:MAG: hypothetical protein H7281_06920 [Bacteriovorax sp.]|nr:hypothetical protein [Bacteriovorax sp.]
MVIKLISLCLIVFSFDLYSAELDCIIRQNLEPVSETRVSTSPELRLNIDSVEGIYAYITEKLDGHFMIEA